MSGSFPAMPGPPLKPGRRALRCLPLEPLETRATYIEVKTPEKTIDYSKYQNRIKELEKETRK